MPELSYNERMEIVRAAIGSDNTYIVDIWDGRVVYTDYKANRTYEADYEIDGKKAKLANRKEVVKVVSYEAAFSAAGSFEQPSLLSEESVARTGLMFRAGSYPDKNIDVSEEDLNDAVSKFEPVEVDYEHVSGLLDGKLGRIEKVEIDKDDKSVLRGTYAMPSWLNEVIGPTEPVPISLTWDIPTKTIKKAAIVANPRIDGARLQAAFSAHLQEQKPMEKQPKTTDPKPFEERVLALFGGEKRPEGFEDVTDEQLATFKAKLEAKPNEPGTPKQEEKPKEKTDADFRLEAMENQLLKREAETFADQTITDRRAIPAERTSLIAMFTQAVKADNRDTAMFSDSGAVKEGECLKAFKASIAARPQHRLLEEGGATRVIDPTEQERAEFSQKNGAMSDERRKELLSHGSIKPGGNN